MNVNNNNAGNEAGNMGPRGWEHGIAPGNGGLGPRLGTWTMGPDRKLFPHWVSLMSIHSPQSAIVYLRLVSDHTAMKNNVLE